MNTSLVSVASEPEGTSAFAAVGSTSDLSLMMNDRFRSLETRDDTGKSKGPLPSFALSPTHQRIA